MTLTIYRLDDDGGETAETYENITNFYLAAGTIYTNTTEEKDGVTEYGGHEIEYNGEEFEVDA